MKFQEALAATTVLSVLVAASTTRDEHVEPCASISSIYAAPTNFEYPSGYVPAQLAYDCLKSVPVDKDGDDKIIKEFQMGLEWQSNLEYFKDPPAGYEDPPIHIKGRITDLLNALHSDQVESEYDLHLTIRDIITSAHDSHFWYGADILDVVTFQRPFAIVSISRDGVDLPRVYTEYDIELAWNDTSFKPSEITKINGQSVADYLGNSSWLTSDSQDANGRYNNLFPALRDNSQSDGSFKNPMRFTEAWTNVTFANGTSQSHMNYAWANAEFFAAGVHDGAAFFQECCTTNSTTNSRKRSESIKRSVPSVLAKRESNGVETPKQAMEFNTTGLKVHYLDNSDVGVVEIRSNSPATDEDPTIHQDEIQRGLSEFIADAKSKGKTKMILDFRGNGGGNAWLSWEVFRQFFPKVEPADVTRYREHDDFTAIGNAAASIIATKNLAEEHPDIHSAMSTAWSCEYNWTAYDKPDASSYTSFEDYASPRDFHNDQYTGLIRRNLTEYVSWVYPGSTITGTLDRSNYTEQPFDSMNIVMLHDGYCGSACASMSEYFKNAGKVRSIVIGGKPETAPMQGVSMTKGGYVFSLSGENNLSDRANMTLNALEIVAPDQVGKYNDTLQKYIDGMEHFKARARGQLNGEDHIQPGDKDQVPLHFVYEASDCRIFYTMEMIFRPEKVWEYAADVAWNAGKCVLNSTKHPSSISGGDNWDPEHPGGFSDAGVRANGSGAPGQGAAVRDRVSVTLLTLVFGVVVASIAL